MMMQIMQLERIPNDSVKRIVGGFYEAGFDWTLGLFELDDYDLYETGINSDDLGFLDHLTIALAVDRDNGDRFLVGVELL